MATLEKYCANVDKGYPVTLFFKNADCACDKNCKLNPSISTINTPAQLQKYRIITQCYLANARVRDNNTVSHFTFAT